MIQYALPVGYYCFIIIISLFNVGIKNKKEIYNKKLITINSSIKIKLPYIK